MSLGHFREGWFLSLASFLADRGQRTTTTCSHSFRNVGHLLLIMIIMILIMNVEHLKNHTNHSQSTDKVT